MYENTPLKQKEKELNTYAKKTYGIDTKEPLPPESVKARYDIAYNEKQGRERAADTAESQSKTRENPEARQLLAEHAEQFRKEGHEILEQALKDTKKYVKKNGTYYHERAQADMESDLAKRSEAEAQFAATHDQIRNLPEINFESTQKAIEDLPESNGPNN